MQGFKGTRSSVLTAFISQSGFAVSDSMTCELQGARYLMVPVGGPSRVPGGDGARGKMPKTRSGKRKRGTNDTNEHLCSSEKERDAHKSKKPRHQESVDAAGHVPARRFGQND